LTRYGAARLDKEGNITNRHFSVADNECVYGIAGAFSKHLARAREGDLRATQDYLLVATNLAQPEDKLDRRVHYAVANAETDDGRVRFGDNPRGVGKLAAEHNSKVPKQ